VIAYLLETPGGAHVDEIWTLDAVQHGDAALLNADSLSANFDWSDHARDILNFLLYYLPSDIVDPSMPLPTNLERLPESVAENRRKEGFLSRKFIAVGHSYGGTSSYVLYLSFPLLFCLIQILGILRTLAALTVPAPFDTLVLVDPQIHMPPNYMGGLSTLQKFVFGALTRRDTWSSK
jgi:pimeloyl-ACP methyl ester carboxylesterase